MRRCLPALSVRTICFASGRSTCRDSGVTFAMEGEALLTGIGYVRNVRLPHDVFVVKVRNNEITPMVLKVLEGMLRGQSKRDGCGFGLLCINLLNIDFKRAFNTVAREILKTRVDVERVSARDPVVRGSQFEFC